MHFSCLQTNSVLMPVFDCNISNTVGITNVCASFSLTSTQNNLFTFSNLLLSGDIEVNPGPPFTLEDLAVKFDDLKSELRDLRKDISKISSVSNDVKIALEGLNNLKADVEKNKEDINRMYDYNNELYTTHKDEVNKLKARVMEQEQRIEKQEIYSRRENVLLKGIEEKEDEDVFEAVLNNLNIDDKDDKIVKSDLQRVHRLGRKESGKNRPIIARFVSYGKKQDVIKNKKEIKDKKNVKITNDLTARQRDILFVMSQRYPSDSFWFRGDQLIRNNVRYDTAEYYSGETASRQHGGAAWQGDSSRGTGQGDGWRGTGRGAGYRGRGGRGGLGRGRGGGPAANQGHDGGARGASGGDHR